MDWLVSGCDGALSDYGFYTSDESLSNLEKKSRRIADRAAIIADSTKFGRRALTRFASLGEIQLLVTDDELPAADCEKIRAAGVEVLFAKVKPSREG